MPFALSSLYPALSFLWAAFTPVSIATTSIASLPAKRNLADASRDPTPSRSYFDSLSPPLPTLISLPFFSRQLPLPPSTYEPLGMAPLVHVSLRISGEKAGAGREGRNL